MSERDPARLFLPRFVPQWVADVGPAVAIMLPATAIIAGGGDHPSEPKPAGLFAYALIAAAPLVFRRRWPLEVLAWTIAVAIVTGYGPAYALPLLFALFNVAALQGRRTGVAAAGLVFLAQLVAVHLHNSDLPFEGFLARAAATGLALAAGLYVHTRHAYVEGLRDRAARAERERELLASQAVAEERVRIARELHDVVAHNVSLMVVQAQAVGAVTSDERERGALDQIAALGRQGLAEMHRMLGVLRPGDDAVEADLAPQPGVGDLEALVEQARGAGLEVVLTVEGEPRPLPAGVDLSAYRIVQEALTNVVRHSGSKQAAVTIRYGAAGLDLSVVDEGRGPSSNGHGGHGLVGMRERVALFGGELSAGPGPGGRGYAVRAVLPTEA